jgi:integrase
LSSDKELQRAKWLTSFASGQKWLEKIGSVNTQKIFTDYFKRYCDYVNQTPDQLISLKLLGLQNVGTEKEFIAEDLLETYFRENKGMKPTARLMMKNTVFSFYKHNKRSLEPSTASNIKNETFESKKRKPTLEDLEALEKAMRTSRDKALLWFVASSSCRVGTVVLLKWQDLKPTQNANVPYSLEIESARLKGSGKGRYKGIKQITFVHRYASERLEAYKQEAKVKGYDLKEDSPLFIAYYQKGKEKPQNPLTIKGINELFNHVSLSAFGDLEKKRFSIHDLREFFQSAFESAGIQENLISPLMAHKVAGIAQNYSSHDCKELIGKYETALPYLVPKSVSELEIQLEKNEEEQSKRIKFLEQRLLDNGLSINKQLANMQEDMRNQAIEILQLQDRKGIKPKALKDTRP